MLFQVFDLELNDIHTLHSTRAEAQRKADSLNSFEPDDAPVRFIVMEMND